MSLVYLNELDNQVKLQKTPEGAFITDDVAGSDIAYMNASRFSRFRIQPQNFSAGIPSTNVPVVFKIQPGTMPKVDHAFLEFTIAETGGANSGTALPAPLCIDHMIISLNGSLDQDQLWTGDQLYQQFQLYDRNTTDNMLAFNNLNMTATAFASPTAIAAGASKTYTVPLTGSLLARLNPQSNSSDITVQVFFNSLQQSGTGVLHLQNATLVAACRLNPHSENQIQKLMNKYDYNIPYITGVSNQVSVSLSAGNTTYITLNQSSGVACALSFTIQASRAIAGGALYTYTPLGGSSETAEGGAFIDLLDSSGRTLLGSGQVGPFWIRCIHAAEHTQGYQSSVTPIYTLWFASNPAHAISKGSMNSGMIRFDSSGQQLVLRPGTGFVTGTYIVYYTMYYYNRQIQDRVSGNFTKVM